jgi:hypothetical protein
VIGRLHFEGFSSGGEADRDFGPLPFHVILYIRGARPLNENVGRYKSWPIYRLSGYEIEFDAGSRRGDP